MSKGALVLSMGLHLGLACLAWKRPSVHRENSGRDAHGENVLFPDQSLAESFAAETVEPPSGPAVEPLPVRPATDAPPGMAATLHPLSVATVSSIPASSQSAPVPAPLQGATHGRPASLRREHGNRGGLSADAGRGGVPPGFAPPKFRRRSPPRYPAEARSQRLEGVVLLRVEVDAGGHVADVSVRRGCGHAMLDGAALAAVRSWQFEPATQEGVAVAASVEVPIRFRFESGVSKRM